MKIEICILKISSLKRGGLKNVFINKKIENNNVKDRLYCLVI